MKYKGYIINPEPYQLADSLEWAMCVYIMRDDGHSLTSKPFYARNALQTEQEAVQHCVELGRRIIDGEIDNCSVADL